MDISINYSTVIARCKDFSAFEGREYFSQDGESLYSSVLITDQDDDLVNGYIVTSMQLIEEVIAKKAACSFTTSGCTFALEVDESRFVKQGSLGKNIEEASVAYAMSQWLKERKPERFEAYDTIFKEMCSVIRTNVYTKKRPS